MNRQDLERLTQQALAGKLLSPDVSREKAREIVEGRVHGCVRTTGCTPAALSTDDRPRYERWLQGNRRALVRAGLEASGELGPDAMKRLWSREQGRRHGAIATDFEQEIDGMFDDGDSYEVPSDPRLAPVSREFLDHDDSDRRSP